MQPIKKLESRSLSGDTLRMAPKILFSNTITTLINIAFSVLLLLLFCMGLFYIFTVKVMRSNRRRMVVFQKFSPPFQPILWETKLNCNLQLVKLVFLRLALVKRVHLTFTLVHCVLSVCCDTSFSLL